MNSLSTQALNIINQYIHLPFKLGGVQCPYFNNERLKLHGGLRVLVGKGSPDDIMDEALIISLHDKTSLDTMTPENAKKFLVDHKIGIDCSGFVYYVLDAELKSRGKFGLGKLLHFPLVKNPLRKILTHLRPAENTNVLSLAHDRNSVAVELQNIAPGDLIVLKNTGPEHGLQHVLLVTKTVINGTELTSISYAHSFAWSSEGRYGNGVREGQIIFTNPTGTLLDQEWVEKGATGEQNETFVHAKMAEVLEVRRLKIFQG